ncbi:tRNA (adenosine(37)-N6)-threonylcarbamoyltransferase complex dimerization subunit type 1 TsaB [Niameybacter massiliensis]|uniref:tRNA (Adenosine(37)-N6)-threonylcarbamoyltransferase complex dimerization subunit type 1 TsaB n=1 Tax=Holtiella tumoricola TaxID=3018743 RepID=A0AA42DJA5_9FIRM|nr:MULTISPECIES: tRNA (adenosine(37)-N6)-threonylcarbamoyltransferase complex dimerization subunit type 1 TsaB [Lachnospirales]MDA3729997.1 tRNA (adenosine(37)-N6)-threonylcarbamoyltransferase complex dimerization subunit type 1 TsaB [Holtiella tumoricola]
MNILAIDASGLSGSVAYISDYKLVGEYYICHKLTHSQTIMPMLEHLKGLIGFEMNEIDAVAVTSGPGSFTGIRIGVATAKAMALAIGVPIIGIPTLDVMAHNISFASEVICPIMDARRNQVYTGIYQWKNGTLEREGDHLAVEIDELLEKLAGRQTIFLGDGVDVLKGKITDVMGDAAQFAPSFLHMQRASVLAQLACEAFEKGEMVDADEFVPIYLRKSQAERELEEREQSGH